MIGGRAGTPEVVSIQYLRGAAALLVVVAHACDQFPVGPLQPLLSVIGQGGVDIFFVISGYVMTYTTAVHKYDRATFYRRRITRIVPLYWALTLGTAVLLVAAGGLSRDSRFSWADLFTSLLFIPHHNAGEPGVIAPVLKLGWTLNYEMFFYAWFGALITLSAAARAAWLTAIFSVLVVVTSLFHPNAAPLLFWGRPVILEFLFGCAIGCCDLRGATVGLPQTIWRTALVAGTVAFLVLGAADGNLGERVQLRGIPAALIVLAAIGLERGASRVWRSRLLHFLGDASYSIYLAHLFAVVGLRILLIRLHATPTEPFGAIVWSMIGVAAGASSGCLVYLWVERPLGQAVKYGVMRIGVRSSPA